MKKVVSLMCVTMIDPATGWFEMRPIKGKHAYTVANQVEQAWLTRYPWPTTVIYDRGNEFMAEFSTMIKEDYGVIRKPITAHNPQANSVLERIHQTLGNILRTTFEIHDDQYLDEDDPWSGILAAAMFALRATYHTRLQASPTQLVFGRDAMFNIKYEADWHLIKQRKQKEIDGNNKRENNTHLPHHYKVGDKVLIKRGLKHKYGGNPYEGPYEIIRVNDNGTIRYQKGAVTDTINIRNAQPYFD